jgi:hypothetical protein
MEDEQIHDRIEYFVAEEQELYERGAEGGLTDSEHRRLESIKSVSISAGTCSVSVVRSERPVMSQALHVFATPAAKRATSSDRWHFARSLDSRRAVSPLWPRRSRLQRRHAGAAEHKSVRSQICCPRTSPA